MCVISLREAFGGNSADIRAVCSVHSIVATYYLAVCLAGIPGTQAE